MPEVAAKITDALNIATIGIGSGATEICDGQILVINDLLGFSIGSVPKFAKPKLNMADLIRAAVSSYREDVRSYTVPDKPAKDLVT
jgi:3-methyl-2-oxobutanoate hydroxymethyltransferase